MTPGQELYLAEKLDGWECDGQEVLDSLKPEPGAGEEKPSS